MHCRACPIVLTASALAAVGFFGMGFASSKPQDHVSLEQAAPAAAPPARTAPAAANPAAAPLVFGVDDVHSLALFRVQHMGASNFWGRFNTVEGSFAFTPGSAEGMRFDITIKTDSVDTGVDKLDQHLRSPDFFAAKDFPTMTFKSTGATKTGESTYDLKGDLTIRGITKPITAKLDFAGMADMGMGQRSGFEATFTIQRGDFGVSYMLDKGGLGKDVRVVVCLEGVAQDTKK